MQMREADIVEDAAVVVGAAAVRLIASRACDHCFRTNLPSARPSRHRLSPPPGSRYRHRTPFRPQPGMRGLGRGLALATSPPPAVMA